MAKSSVHIAPAKQASARHVRTSLHLSLQLMRRHKWKHLCHAPHCLAAGYHLASFQAVPYTEISDIDFSTPKNKKRKPWYHLYFTYTWGFKLNTQTSSPNWTNCNWVRFLLHKFVNLEFYLSYLDSPIVTCLSASRVYTASTIIWSLLERRSESVIHRLHTRVWAMLLQFDHHTRTLQEYWEAHAWSVKLKTLVTAKSWSYHSLSLQISCMHWPCLTITVTDKKDLLPRKPPLSHKTNSLGLCTWEDSLPAIHQPKWHTTHRISVQSSHSLELHQMEQCLVSVAVQVWLR